MKDPLTVMQDVPVEIICLSVTPPLIRSGRMTCHPDGSCELLLEEAEPRLQPGMRVVLEGGPDRPVRMKGLVVRREGRLLRVETERVVPPDKRSFPRMYGGIHVRYRVLAEGEGDAAVRAAGEGGEWREPDPFMDFSGTGLRFEDRLCCKPKDLLLLELALPSSERRWRVKARVVRVEPIRPEDLERRDRETGREPAATHQIAVQFVDLPADATEALTAFAMRIQDALLKA